MDTNPVKKYREMLGLSLTQLEYHAQIHRQTIIRTEQGCYAQIPPTLLNYLLARLGNSDSDLASDYISWVDQKRRDSFGKLCLPLPNFDPARHPFTHWREASELGRLEVCKLFCIHPSTLSRFENKLVMQSIPEQLQDALLTSGYSQEAINDLSIRYSLYREYQLARRSGQVSRIASASNFIIAYMNTHKEAAGF